MTEQRIIVQFPCAGDLNGCEAQVYNRGAYCDRCEQAQLDAYYEDGQRFFNERDCGGVYDGYGVTSDADPGL